VVVVSSDRPVSVMHGGAEMTAACELKAVRDIPTRPPTMVEWLNDR
jgi:hypothetical protein